MFAAYYARARRDPPPAESRPSSPTRTRRLQTLAAVTALTFGPDFIHCGRASGRAGGWFFLTECAGGGVAISLGSRRLERARDSAQRGVPPARGSSWRTGRFQK